MFGFKNFFSKSTFAPTSANITTLEEFSKILRIANDYGSLAQSGYIENTIVNTCIKRTAEAMNSIPLKYFLDDKEVDLSISNPLIKSFIQAIEDPSTDYDQELLLESVYSGLTIDGEGYIFPREDVAGRVSGLEYLRPDKISKTTSSDSRVHQYEYNSGDKRLVFGRTFSRIEGERVENVPSLIGRFNLVLYKTYNPLSDTEGLSRLAAAGLSIDGHNGALEWNNSILKNAGKPSGMLSQEKTDGQALNPEQIDDLIKRLNVQTTGKNRGKIMVFNSPMKFEKFSMNAQEMDFITGIVQRATDICNALDYPPFLLGFVGSTFNNQAEAKLSLYENSAIPKTQHFYGNIAKFLSRKYDVNFKIKTDVTTLDAMAPRFAEKNASIILQFEKNVIDQAEVREMLGHESKPGGDGLFFGDFGNSQNNNNIES